jgi:heme-degrading monooxygenase HmoA
VSGGEVFRIDRFDVPDAAVEEFLAGLQPTHDLLRGLPGYGQNLLLEGARENGTTRLLTFVVWEDEAAIAGAQRAVQRLHDAGGFAPARMAARLGIRADLGVYRPLPWPDAR